MGRSKWVGLVGIMMVAIAGCASEETPPVATSPAASPTVAPATSPTVAASPQPAPGATAAPVTQPAGAAKPAAPAVSGLIQPTNPQERARQVQTEIQGAQRNPFAGLQPNITVVPAATPSPVPNVAGLPGTPTVGAPNRTGGGTAPNRGTTAPRTAARPPQPKAVAKAPTPPRATTPRGANTATKPKPQVAALPPKPSTAAADGVEVTGVITIGQVPQAIVVVPNGATQYVSVGQRISNGRVLVKRIENGYGADPIVILEENGVEVAKGVGDRPTTADRQATS